jgi:hypothetical protein
MKLLTGCVVSAGLALAGWSANAQMLAPYGAGHAPYQTVSDFEEPYGGAPPAPPPYGAPPPPYGAAPPPYAPSRTPYGYYEPGLMPPHEVYAVLRENGFLPLGIPRRQGSTYEISAMDPNGEDGRLLIDGRNGRIIRFMPASWMGRSHESGLTGAYGAQAALPLPPTSVRGGPRPPAAIPHVASRDVTSRAIPLPAPKPSQAATAQPQPQPQPQPQVSAAAPPPAATAPVGEAKPPQPVVRPTQDMPAVQGLE